MQTLQFNPYSASQLAEIMETRIEQGFRPGAVPDEVIQKIATHVAENSGDCRQALEILLRTGREADKQGEKELTENLAEKFLQS
jgi:cell division control protein 6